MVSTLSPRDGVVDYDSTADPPLVSREGDRTVVWLAGEHDISTVFVVANALARAIAADEADIVVDLSGVTFIGAATVDELICGRNFLRERSRSLTLRAPSRSAMRVIGLCQLTALIDRC